MEQEMNEGNLCLLKVMETSTLCNNGGIMLSRETYEALNFPHLAALKVSCRCLQIVFCHYFLELI